MPSPPSHVLFSGVHQKTPRRPKWLAFPKISKGLSMCRAEARYSRISRSSPKTFYDQVMFRFLTTYKYFPRHPLFLQSIFHGSIASYPNLSLLLPWFVLFSSKKKTFSSLICLLLGSSIKRVSPHVHVAMAPSQTHTALKRYWTFQRW
jgi:hypothetical protein